MSIIIRKVVENKKIGPATHLGLNKSTTFNTLGHKMGSPKMAFHFLLSYHLSNLYNFGPDVTFALMQCLKCLRIFFCENDTFLLRD